MSDKLVVEIDSKDAEVAMRNLDRLTTAAEQMGKAFENTKGATSALRELRLMLTGIKGQGSSLDELKNSIQSLNSTADSLKRSFAGSVGQLGRIFKNEMAELKSIVQETGLGIGKAAADSLSDGIASPESRRKVVGAMRAQVAEMQAAYEQELAKGVKFSGRDLFDFKSWGLNIGADAKQAIRDGLVKDAAPIPVEKILGLDKSQVVKSAKDSAAVFQEAYNAEMRSMQRSAMPIAKVSRIDAADATYASAMSQMKDYYKELELGTNSGVASAGKMSNAFKRLTIDGNDLHSMARGLASGFNLLWLTWGNLVPLFAGAAISNGFMQTIKLGMQVGHTFQTIASLGEVSAEGVAMLRTQLYEIGQSGPYGPEQVAEAMKTLALAGLQLNEILAVTPTVLNFALAGTTSITQAADVLVSVTSAFGTGAAGFEESADIITRSAADSKASVESFGEAMKTASVVGELYGAAQRDVALMIQYLSQVGIQGTSAGTAVRNAMADISGRSGQAQRILKSLGAEFKQSTGEVIPFLDQMRELNRITKDYDAISQKNIINAIYGERGSKVAAVGLQAFNTAAKDASKYSNKLEEDLARLEDAAGDSAIASAQMAQSTQKAFEAVAATAKTVLVEAFDAIEPQMYLVADALRKAFASDEAKEGLRTLVTAVADLAMVVAKNLSTIVEYGLAWAAFKVAVFGANAIVTAATALLGLYTNAKIKDTAATIAQTAAEGALSKAIDSKKTATLTSGAAALSMGTKLLGVLPVVGNAVLLGSLAWDIYKSSVGEAGKTVDNYVDTKADNIITALENETRHLREVNELRAQGLTLMEAEARVKFSNSKSEMLSGSEAKIEAAEEEIRRLRAVNASYTSPTDASYGLLERKQNLVKIVQLENEIAETRSRQGTDALRMVLAENDRREAAQEALRLTRLEQEAAKKATVTGTKTWSLDEFQGGGKGFGGPREFYEAQKTAFDKSIQEIEKRGKVEIEKLQSIAADKKAILDSEQQAGLLSTEEYNSQLMVLLKSSEDAQIAEIRKTSQDFRAEYDKRHRTISDLIAKAEATSAKGKGASAAKAANLKELRAELSTLEELGVTSFERWASATDKLTSRYDKDLQVAINKNLGSLKKLREEDDKFWKDQTDELAKAKALDAVNQQYANINDSVFSLDEANKAYALAFADSASKSEAYIGKLSTELETAQYAAEEFWHAAMADGEFSDTDSSGYISYLKKIQGLEKLILDARAKGATLADDNGQAAFDRKRREQNKKLASDLSDAVMTGLFDGAEAGKKKLRDVLVAELRKPIKMVVDLVMNTVVGSFMGGIGGAAQAGTANAGISALSTVGSIGTGASLLGKFGISGFGAGYSSATSAAAMGANFVGPPASAAGGAVGAGAQFAAVMPWLLGAGAVAALWKPLFGRKLKDSGIQGTFGGQTGFEGESFEFYKGGLFRSDKTKTNPLDEEVRKTLGDAFNAMRVEVGTFATLLGLETDRLAGFTTSIKLSLKGLDDKAAQEKIQEALATANNELAEQVIGSWQQTVETISRTISTGDNTEAGNGLVETQFDEVITKTSYTASEYAKEGEKAIDTLRRLATSLGTVNAIWDNLGYTVYEASLRGADAASKIGEAFGGLEAMAAQFGTYIDQYYTEDEKRTNLARSSANALQSVGLAVSAEDILGASRPIVRGFVEAVLAEFGPSSPQYVAAVQQANAIAGLYAPLGDAMESVANTLSETMKRLQSDTAGLEIELLRAQGNTAGADAAQRTLDITGLSDAEIAVYDYNTALRDQIEALDAAAAEVARQADTRAGFERQLLQLQGDTAALRLLDIAGMDEYNVSLYDQVQSLTAAASAAQTLADNARNLRASLISVEGRFSGGGFSRQYMASDAATEISSLLASVGINKDAGAITSVLLNSTTDEVESYFREIWEVLDTDEARLRLVEVTNTMLDLAKVSDTVAEKFQKQTEGLSKLATDVNSLFAARNSAGNLLDKIAGAMGNQGSFAAQREGELWSALYNTKDLKKQVDLAEQLTDIVISRQKTEVQNAEKLMEFGQGLKSYVDSLKLGAVSPLTNAQKLTEASKQYSETLSKAMSGDTNAQANLQNISSSFLEIARTYYAGNEDFVSIFNSVTSSLESLGINSMSESQQQLAVGNQSLAELQKLYTITESTYSSLNSQYESALSSLALAQDSLVLQAKSFDQLVSISGILSSLPGEISARLPDLDISLPNLGTSTQNEDTVDNTALIEEVKALRLEIAKLAAENREDAAKVAAATIMASQANAATITDATTKAARTAEVKQGATIQ